MTNAKKNFLKNLITATIMATATLAIVIGCIMIPIVEVSHSTGNCVRVVSNDASYSCDNLPTRYDTVWVN